jgi:hypothetical protein
VILITQKLNLLKKTQKVKIKLKKSAKAKIKETCGEMLETNRTPKSYVAARRGLSLVKAIKWGIYAIDSSMCQKGGVPLLRGRTFLERAAHLLRGGTPLPSSSFHLACIEVVGEVAAL